MKKKRATCNGTVTKVVCAALLAVTAGALNTGCVAPQPGADDPTPSAPPPATSAVAPAAPPPTAPAAVAPGATPAAAAPGTAAAPPVPPPPPPILPFDEAVAKATRAVFSSAPATNVNPALVVIDPLVDGMTGYQSKATQSIQDRILHIVTSDFPQYAAQPITADSLRRNPRILVGTFTPVNAQMKTIGEREAYRFCLVMGDLSTGKIVAKSVARSHLENVDATPADTFGDSPVWSTDPHVAAYISTCQASKVGDPIKPEYFEGLLAAALINEAAEAYADGHYAESLDLYQTARKTPAGDQLRVYNGVYLAQIKLGHPEAAAAAFRDLVDYGLRNKRLAVKFLFRPGSVRFNTDSKQSGLYGMWIEQIAAQSASTHACLQVTGHTSATGPAALNDSLSLMRAEYIQSRLEEDVPALNGRTVAAGVGSRENLVGTGHDDASDMLDRRVELKPIDPCN